jgi:hypothetical protein
MTETEAEVGGVVRTSVLNLAIAKSLEKESLSLEMRRKMQLSDSVFASGLFRGRASRWPC